MIIRHIAIYTEEDRDSIQIWWCTDITVCYIHATEGNLTPDTSSILVYYLRREK